MRTEPWCLGRTRAGDGLPIRGDSKGGQSLSDLWLTFRLKKGFWNLIYGIERILECLRLSRKDRLKAYTVDV